MSELVLAVDAGTTGVRAMVFDARSADRGAAYEELRPVFPRPGWVELDALNVWEAVRRVIAGALGNAGVRAADIAAIGIANQRATTVLWDSRSGEPLHNAIVWQDLRTADRVRQLLDQGIYTNTMASATKVEWLLRNVAGADQSARQGDLRFGTIDSWLVWKMTGGLCHVTDHSNASCTGLYDFGEGAWDPIVLDALALPRSLLPEIVPSSAVYGTSKSAACGLATPVAAVAGDQQAAMFGQLCDNPGDVKITFGTSAMVDTNTGPAPVLSLRGAYPLVLWGIDGGRLFCLEGTAITAGAAVQWLRDGLGVIARADETDALARAVSDSGGVWAVPAFQGLGTPYMDPEARAVIGGISRASTKAHVVRAFLEGIAFRSGEIVDTLMGDAGMTCPPVVRADGGAAANDFLMQALADVLGVVVERPATLQATALGAAYLAGLATGVWNERTELREAWRLGARFIPRWNSAERAEKRAQWQKIVSLVREGAVAR